MRQVLLRIKKLEGLRLVVTPRDPLSESLALGLRSLSNDDLDLFGEALALVQSGNVDQLNQRHVAVWNAVFAQELELLT